MGAQLTHVDLAQRREAHKRQRADSVQRVNAMVQTQQALGTELSDGLTRLKGQSEELKRLQQPEQDGLLFALVRPFTARRSALARRSVAEELLAVYEKTGVRLREATAFADELRLCALELQQEVDRLHRDLGESLHNERVAANHVLEAEEALDELEVDAALNEATRARRRDRFTFDMKTEAVQLELFKVAAAQCRQHLEPARALRDTVLQLHEDMARYVINATHTVNAAGRRIQGLGMMADAPLVVHELQASLDELSAAMADTEKYIETSRKLVEQVLPELSAGLDVQDEVDIQTLTDSLQSVDRKRARTLAEQALRDAAEAEIDALLGRDL
jgi:hypothetical protein